MSAEQPKTNEGSQLGVIRPFRIDDRPAVREICCRTAYRNLGAASFFEDDELFADYWTKYYTDFEPQSCWVVEEEQTVVAYLTGCVNSTRYARVLSRKILPSLLWRIFFRLLGQKYRRAESRRTLGWFVKHSWREAPVVPRNRYPAHYHCNVLPGGYGKRYYSNLVLTFLDHLESMGIDRLHGQVEDAAARGIWLRMINQCAQENGLEHLLEYYSESTSSFQCHVLKKPQKRVNRVWGVDRTAYRLWINWLRERYRL